MSSVAQLLLPLLFIIVISALYLKLINSSGVLRTPSSWFFYGIAFLSLSVLNIISTVLLNGYYSIMNFRYVLDILTIGVFTLSINIYNKHLTFYQQKPGQATDKWKFGSKNWWIRRNEAHDYFNYISKLLSKKKGVNIDYIITKLIGSINKN